MTSPTSALARLVGSGSDNERGMTLGIELPLDNDFASDHDARRGTGADHDRVHGIPDLSRHRERAELVDRLGFRAIWMRDVPLWLPRALGDAGQVFDPIVYLGYLAAATRNVLLVTAAIVLPLRQPLLLAKQVASIDALSGGRRILGVASGDRPLEYPAFGIDVETEQADEWLAFDQQQADEDEASLRREVFADVTNRLKERRNGLG